MGKKDIPKKAQQACCECQTAIEGKGTYCLIFRSALHVSPLTQAAPQTCHRPHLDVGAARVTSACPTRPTRPPLSASTPSLSPAAPSATY